MSTIKSPSDSLARRLRHRYGDWAVVTGASSGIGRSCAVLLAQAGLNLVLVARDRRALDALAEECRTQHRVAVQVIAADLGDVTEVEAVIEGCRDLDVGLLVAAAGFGTSGPFLQASIPKELAMLDVNCRALLLLSQRFGQRFAARGRGGIVLMASLVGFQGTPFTAHYAATKAYVQTLAEGLHIELAGAGVDVVASAPGPVKTGFAERADLRMGAATTPEVVARATLAGLGRRATVRPGALTKLLSTSLAPLPRGMRARIMGRVMAGMTKHQHEETTRPRETTKPA